MPTAPYRVPAAPRPQYATYVPGRSAGVFKTHPRIGDVKNALHLRSRRDRNTGRFPFDTDITVYTLRGDEYVAWIHIPAGTESSDYPELFRS